MDKFMSYDEIKEQAKDPHITAESLNILVSKTLELSTLKQHELTRLKELLATLEAELGNKNDNV